MNLKQKGKVLTSKSVGTVPSSYGKRIYRAVVSQKFEKHWLRVIGKRVNCTLVQALRICTGRTAHRGSRGIAVLYRH